MGRIVPLFARQKYSILTLHRRNSSLGADRKGSGRCIRDARSCRPRARLVWRRWPHSATTDLEPNIETVRRNLAAEFGCDQEEMAITRNASEALQIVYTTLGEIDTFATAMEEIAAKGAD